MAAGFIRLQHNIGQDTSIDIIIDVFSRGTATSNINYIGL